MWSGCNILPKIIFFCVSCFKSYILKTDRHTDRHIDTMKSLPLPHTREVKMSQSHVPDPALNRNSFKWWVDLMSQILPSTEIVLNMLTYDMLPGKLNLYLAIACSLYFSVLHDPFWGKVHLLNVGVKLFNYIMCNSWEKNISWTEFYE